MDRFQTKFTFWYQQFEFTSIMMMFLTYPFRFLRKHYVKLFQMEHYVDTFENGSIFLASLQFVVYMLLFSFLLTIPSIFGLYSQVLSADYVSLRSSVLDAIPPDFNVVLKNKTLAVDPPHSFKVEIPQNLMNLWEERLMFPFYATPMELLDQVLNVLLDEYTSPFSLYPSIQEFRINDTVEYREDKTVQWVYGGNWNEGVVLKKYPKGRPTEFLYTIQSLSEENAGPKNYSAVSLRSKTRDILFSNEAILPAVDADNMDAYTFENGTIIDSNVVAIMHYKSFFVVQGFSWYLSRYWKSPHLTNPNDYGIWQNYTRTAIERYKPLVAFGFIYCSVENREIECSREIAESNLNTYIPSNHFTSVKVACVALLFVVAFSMVGLRNLMLHWVIRVPLSYVVVNLLRHVDTELTGFFRIGHVSLYTVIPSIMLEECVRAVLAFVFMSGKFTQYEDYLFYLFEHLYLMELLWLAINCHIIINVRSRKNALEVAQTMELRAKQYKPPTARTQEIPAESDKPLCRICFGGPEDGRLISPCLCKGTMRFVHLDCLNTWRASSTNPKSALQCDQCKYKYSITRTKVATIIRSALVLHTLTITAFFVLILFMSYLIALIDSTFFENAMAYDAIGVSFDSLFEEIENSELDELTVVRLLLLFFQLLESIGISVSHFIFGIAVVGLFGFLSIGVASIPYYFFGPRRGGDDLGPIIIAILIGCVKIMASFYQMFKNYTGTLLKSVENIILEVGEGFDQTKYATMEEEIPEELIDSESDDDEDDDDEVVQMGWGKVHEPTSKIDNTESTSTMENDVTTAQLHTASLENIQNLEGTQTLHQRKPYVTNDE